MPRRKRAKSPKVDWEKKAQEYLEGWKRCLADWKNYQNKQEEREGEIKKRTLEEIALDLLTVIDHFELALAHAPKEGNDWEKGVEQIMKQLINILEKYGIREMGVKKGDKFNPHLHECLDKTGEGDNLIINSVARKGYFINSNLLRPAQVKVKRKAN